MPFSPLKPKDAKECCAALVRGYVALSGRPQDWLPHSDGNPWIIALHCKECVTTIRYTHAGGWEREQ